MLWALPRSWFIMHAILSTPFLNFLLELNVRPQGDSSIKFETSQWIPLATYGDFHSIFNQSRHPCRSWVWQISSCTCGRFWDEWGCPAKAYRKLAMEMPKGANTIPLGRLTTFAHHRHGKLANSCNQFSSFGKVKQDFRVQGQGLMTTGSACNACRNILNPARAFQDQQCCPTLDAYHFWANHWCSDTHTQELILVKVFLRLPLHSGGRRLVQSWFEDWLDRGTVPESLDYQRKWPCVTLLCSADKAWIRWGIDKAV